MTALQGWIVIGLLVLIVLGIVGGQPRPTVATPALQAIDKSTRPTVLRNPLATSGRAINLPIVFPALGRSGRQRRGF